jgi:chromosome partitioning protein
LVGLKEREYVLKSKIYNMLDEYDFVFIDCPPSFGLLSVNAWSAASLVLIPLQCEYYALEGMVFLLNNILKIKKTFNSDLVISGVVLTMYEKRNILSKEIELDVRKSLGDKVYKTVIPRNVKIAEAPSHGKPVLFYDFKSTGTIAYLELAREFLKKHKRNGEIQ